MKTPIKKNLFSKYSYPWKVAKLRKLLNLQNVNISDSSRHVQDVGIINVCHWFIRS